MKSYTNIEQSKKLAEILSLESADMAYERREFTSDIPSKVEYNCVPSFKSDAVLYKAIPCWSLAALLEYLRNINSTVYIPMLYVHDNKWMLQFVERGHGNVAEVECDNPTDTCYEMILKLKELNLL